MNNRMIHLLGVPEGSIVYIAGPMSIYKDQCYNFERFFYWGAILRESGYNVINPAQMDCERMFNGWVYSPDKYNEILAEDIKAIKESADAIFNLAEWQKSKGALAENQAAMNKGIPAFYEDDF